MKDKGGSRMKKYSRIIWALMAVILVCCLVLPASIAYAETPLSVSVVVAGQANTGLGSPFQHHSFVADGVMWVFYQADAANQVVGSWSEDGTTWVALPAITGCNTYNMTANETHGGQFDTWYNAADDTVRFIVVNASTNNSPIAYCSYAINATAHTLTPESAWRTAVAGVANVSYRNPTICLNNSEQVFITYGYVLNGSSDVRVMSTNNSTSATWLPDTGFPIYNMSANASRPSMYGSVIPLYTSGNVSVQYAGYNGSVYRIYQTAVYWNGTSWVRGAVYDIDTSGWWLTDDAEWNYNAVSIDTSINDNDVAIQYSQTNGSKYRTFFNRRANESDAWGSSGLYARNFGAGGWALDYVGAMGIRNAIYSLTYSGWDMSGGSYAVYSNDFDAITGDWSGIAVVASDPEVPYVSTMSDYSYDHSGTGYLGYIFGNQNNDIMYGLYGPALPPVIPTVVSDFVNATGMIVSLLISFLLIVLLLGIAFKEGMNNGWNEGTKLAITAVIGIIIIETIIIAFF